MVLPFAEHFLPRLGYEVKQWIHDEAAQLTASLCSSVYADPIMQWQ